MKKLSTLIVVFFVVSLIYILGYLYVNFIGIMINHTLQAVLNNYVVIFLQLLILSILPLFVGIILKGRGIMNHLSNILLVIACILPFLVFIQILYFFTHPMLCRVPDVPDYTRYLFNTLTAIVCVGIIFTAIRAYGKHQVYIMFSFLIIYLLDLAFKQGWVFYLLR